MTKELPPQPPSGAMALQMMAMFQHVGVALKAREELELADRLAEAADRMYESLAEDPEMRLRPLNEHNYTMRTLSDLASATAMASKYGRDRLAIEITELAQFIAEGN